ncbi:flavin reductase family protein [Paremcibacter congregatus]|uniref:flavin reductase family protein n=1 Tax=Paremcibacter congregatus TaxID=2043170 RepID=UPI0030EE5B3B|tara:strand:+ start:4158 stop:4634 length:477 start_codon:yes stop_codon:yes gene_type:complete
MSKIEPAALRSALGRYPTGVAVVTTTNATHHPVGMTINSFASVSLDPPLILWSIDRQSDLFDVFTGANYYALHVLGQDQQDLSNHFASPGKDKFANLTPEEGLEGLPLLPDHIARFQCRIVARHEGGDHVILVGHIHDIRQNDGAPLVFHDSRYTSLV